MNAAPCILHLPVNLLDSHCPHHLHYWLAHTALICLPLSRNSPMLLDLSIPESPWITTFSIGSSAPTTPTGSTLPVCSNSSLHSWQAHRAYLQSRRAECSVLPTLGVSLERCNSSTAPPARHWTRKLFSPSLFPLQNENNVLLTVTHPGRLHNSITLTISTLYRGVSVRFFIKQNLPGAEECECDAQCVKLSVP